MSVSEGRCLLHYLRLRGKSGVGCREWVVMQSASGGKLANEERQGEAEKGALWISGVSVAAGC